MQKKIIILCARENAHFPVVFEILEHFYQYKTIGLYDDNSDLQGKSVLGVPVIGKIKNFPENVPSGPIEFFIATGNNNFRSQCYNKIVDAGYRLVNVIHPSAVVSKSAKIGMGVFVGANATINNNSIIGNGVLINTGAIVEHDNVIEDFVNISSNVSTAGRVKIRRNAFLGIGASIIPDIKIGENSIVGAGSVVIKNVERGVTVVGNPAR